MNFKKINLNENLTNLKEIMLSFSSIKSEKETNEDRTLYEQLNDLFEDIKYECRNNLNDKEIRALISNLNKTYLKTIVFGVND